MIHRLIVTLACAAVQEVKIADIKKRETLQQSSMPEGLANAMSPGEFLAAQK